MRRALRSLIERVARTGLLLVLAMGSPSLGGAFRCCSSGEHGGGEAHAEAAHDASHGAHDSAPEESSSLPCDCVGECCPPPALAKAAPTIQLGAELRPESSAPVIARGDRRPHGRTGYLLPFANGPPHRLTV